MGQRDLVESSLWRGFGLCEHALFAFVLLNPQHHHGIFSDNPAMSKPLAIPPKRALASKEATLFKDLLNHYETKQLKKGLKTADQILKKYPEHGGPFDRSHYLNFGFLISYQKHYA